VATTSDPDSSTADLQTIPGVGPSVAQDLRRIGIGAVADLVGRDPEQLFDESNAECGAIQDRCLLYTFRCAVYFAEGGREPDRLKWWNWKDR
jgi:hypothetical protein